MNWLAHIFISEDHIDYQLGNLLADHLKGKSWEGDSAQLEEGLKMHGTIDFFTDSHKFVQQSKSRLGKKGYLKGIVIDIAYDHLLLKNWDLYSKVSFERFIDNFYENALTAVESYPDGAQTFVKRVISSNYLASYDSFDGLTATFQRFDRRLPSRISAKDSTANYIPSLKKELNGIEEDFLKFFPDLVRHYKEKSGVDHEEHWLK